MVVIQLPQYKCSYHDKTTVQQFAVKRKIITVLGTRPQFIKAAVLSRLFRNSSCFDEIILHTGQHYDLLMSDVFFKELYLPQPKYNLQVHGGNHGVMTARMMESIESIIMKEAPDAVLVYGDTNSTLAGALVAVKLHIPVFHIEAGLRSFNKKMPEEINRILTDHVSTLLFCPTHLSVLNLANESITEGVYHVGDVMYDASLATMEVFRRNASYTNELVKKFNFVTEDFAFLTIHRAESTDSKETFQNILSYVNSIAKQKELKIVFAVHPRAKKLAEECICKYTSKTVTIYPVSYIETQFILSKAKLVLTDSGGLQKEAYFYRVPCITLRSETEWVETVEAGWNMLWKDQCYNEKSIIEDYGTGDASKRIMNIIERF